MSIRSRLKDGSMIGFLLCIVISIYIGYSIAKGTQKVEVQPLASAPIINYDAREAYQKGLITKDVALSRIDAQLKTLESEGNIQSWSYNSTISKYEVILNNGTTFVYYVK